MSYLIRYFDGLRELSQQAAQLVFSGQAADACLGVADELRTMLERLENQGAADPSTEHLEFFFREMHAECQPANAAYYVSPVCSHVSAILKQGWFVHAVVRSIECTRQTVGMFAARRTVFTAIDAACTKTIAGLEAPVPVAVSGRAPRSTLLPDVLLLLPPGSGVDTKTPAQRRKEIRLAVSNDDPHRIFIR